jgi:hypothetical protein
MLPPWGSIALVEMRNFVAARSPVWLRVTNEPTLCCTKSFRKEALCASSDSIDHITVRSLALGADVGLD